MISGYAVGDAEVVQRLDTLDARLKGELRSGIGRLALKLQREVVQAKLSGQVLNVRTGTLRRSIDQAVIDGGTNISGIVSTNVKYGRFWEYGFKGVETIRAHIRRIKQAFGRPIAERDVMVKPHSRTMNLPERSFLRSALRELEQSGAVRAEIDAAIGRATA